MDPLYTIRLSCEYDNLSLFQYPSKERFDQKVSQSSLGHSQNERNTWGHSRHVTPGGACGYKSDRKIEFFNYVGDSYIHSFRSKAESQGLIFQDNHVVATSVSCHIEPLRFPKTSILKSL